MGTIVTLGYYGSASLFVGLTKQGSMKTHLGFHFRLKADVATNFSIPISCRKDIYVGLREVYKVFEVQSTGHPLHLTEASHHQTAGTKYSSHKLDSSA